MAITQKDVEHIAALARIRLTAAEKEKMTEDLGAILGYVNKLNEVNTDNIEPLAQVTGLENVFRKNSSAFVEASADEVKKLTSQFPSRKENYLKVKQVFPAEKNL